MQDLKDLGKLFKENPYLIVITLVASIVGAILGIMAFYNGLLG